MTSIANRAQSKHHPIEPFSVDTNDPNMPTPTEYPLGLCRFPSTFGISPAFLHLLLARFLYSSSSPTAPAVFIVYFKFITCYYQASLPAGMGCAPSMDSAQHLPARKAQALFRYVSSHFGQIVFVYTG